MGYFKKKTQLICMVNSIEQHYPRLQLFGRGDENSRDFECIINVRLEFTTLRYNLSLFQVCIVPFEPWFHFLY